MRNRLRRCGPSWLVLAVGWLSLAGPGPALGQGTSGPTVADSSVGYIDSAIPINELRLRFEAGYHFTRPTRAEFFYPKPAPAGGPGLPRGETSIDYQDLSSYLELAPTPDLSVFVEAPVRFLNPVINADTAGFADMNAGFKVALWGNCHTLATFQLRTYIPTGDPHRGLGTDHVSLEPALLVNHRLAEKWLLEGEFRYWVPIGGTDFAGDVLRYGLGVSYGTRRPDAFWVTPVVELVGWTVLSGKELVPPAPPPLAIKDASGDTILNAKFGVRLGLGDWGDMYAGYGRALTGDTWYKDIWRVEFRLFF